MTFKERDRVLFKIKKQQLIEHGVEAVASAVVIFILACFGFFFLIGGRV